MSATTIKAGGVWREPPAASATAGDDSLLRQAADAHGALICHWLDLHGAVLLRGWTVDSPVAFADVCAALPLGSLADYFPAEAGREPALQRRPLPTATPASASSTGTVWPTNNLRRTGGYLSPEVLPHTENYYALSWLGEATALGRWAARRAPLPYRRPSPAMGEASGGEG
jgi:hypothetical protein